MERTGAAQSQNSPAGVKKGFDFNFVSPTAFVELPSEGKYYPEDHPLHGETTIEVREMTAHEEDILADVTLQRNGQAINKLISNIIVDKRINTDSLLIGDKNAITIAARINGYGPKYNTTVTCPACNAKNKHSFDLRHLESKHSVITETVVHVRDRVFQFMLPRTGYNVQVKLLNAIESNKMSKTIEKLQKGKANAKLQTNFLKLILHAVENKPDGLWYEDRPVIDQFAEGIPAIDASYIRTMYKALSPDVNMTQEFECSECGHTQDMEVPLNAEFFWPDA
jgi:transcription elongation factor Elf1